MVATLQEKIEEIREELEKAIAKTASSLSGSEDYLYNEAFEEGIRHCMEILEEDIDLDDEEDEEVEYNDYYDEDED